MKYMNFTCLKSVKLSGHFLVYFIYNCFLDRHFEGKLITWLRTWLDYHQDKPSPAKTIRNFYHIYDRISA